MHDAEEMVDREVGFDDCLCGAVNWGVRIFGGGSGKEKRLGGRDFVARKLEKMDPLMKLSVCVGTKDV